MTDEIFRPSRRVCCEFLARLLMVYGPAAPDLLRRNAVKIKGLKARRGAITDPDFRCLPLSPVFAPDTGCAWLGQLCLSI